MVNKLIHFYNDINKNLLIKIINIILNFKIYICKFLRFDNI